MPPSRPEYTRIRLAFAASVFFRELPAATLDALANAARLERCDSGGLLHVANERVDKFWLVIEGGLLVSWINARAEAIPVSMIGPGGFYGVAAILGGGPANSECRAERETLSAVLVGATLRDMEERDLALRAVLRKLLLQRYQATLSFYADSVSASLPEQLARRLLAQALTRHRDPAGGEVELRTSQTDLARMLGASRSKVNTELRRLEDAQVLRLGYRRIYLRDWDRLAELAGGPILFL
jgi:CRP/FNR family transcriptional regulator, cyclic AMP receptor protein